MKKKAIRHKPKKSIFLSNPTKEEIIALVKGNVAVIAWVTEKGAIIRIPEEGLRLAVGAGVLFITEFFKDPNFLQMGIPFVIVEGVSGLAATDPYWDGSDIFTCENPQCPCYGKSKDMGVNVHDTLWARALSTKKLEKN